MNPVRTSLAFTRFDATSAVKAAEIAERRAVRTLWIGNARTHDGTGPAPLYVTASAGAMASVTTSLRIGLFLDLGADVSPLRTAEDVAVLDNLSGGRIELGLIASKDPAWAGRANAFLSAWEKGWPVPGRKTVAVIPQPVQPRIPRIVAGDGTPLDPAHQAGRLLIDGQPQAVGTPGERRILLVKPPFRDLAACGSEQQVLITLTGLRETAMRAGAAEIMIEEDSGDLGRFEACATVLGTAIDPALRCSEEDISAVVTDAWLRGGKKDMTAVVADAWERGGKA
jgi:hypothetical protein